MNPEQRSRLRRKLLQWFRIYKRDLPWRATRDAYAVWVSEIMLQQTRVAIVTERYREFMRRFPTVEVLAAAPLDDVLAVWSGLGYYRRARMMHQAAQVIVRGRDGVLPGTAEGWQVLPGIGRYTAAAIASIAFDEPVAVVDGNVERVLSRLHGRAMQGQKGWSAAEMLLSRTSPGDFNQAMMELGATVCTPKSPACVTCPVREFCATRGEHPVSAPAVRRKQEEGYVLWKRRGMVALVQRGADERLMAGMWELPRIEPNGEPPLLTVKHSITNTDYTVRVFGEPRSHNAASHASKLCWFDAAELMQLPLTGLARKVLRRVGIIQ